MTEQKASSWRLYGWLAILTVGLVIGIYGAVKILVDGHGPSTGGTDQIPWGIFVPTYIFFVAASAGCVIVSLGYAIGIKRFELVMRRAVFLAIVAQIAGGLTILLDLGSPFRVVLPLISPNLQSPIWWMGFFYALYLVLLLLDFFFLSKHDIKKTKIISVAAGLCAIAVHSTLGAIFGFAATRTYFGGAIAPIYFILIAIIIGTALLLLVTTLEYRLRKQEMSPDLASLVSDLGRFLGVALGIAILFVIWKDLAGIRSTVATSALAYQYLLTGPGAWWYWIFVVALGLVIPLGLLISKGTRNPGVITLVSLLVLVGMFAARVEFNLGGQLVAQVFNLEQLQTPIAEYSAKFVEIAVVVLAFSFAALVYTWGDRKLSLDKLPTNG